MTPDKIKDALKKHKTTQRAIAAKIGRSEMSVSSVIHGARVSDYIMRSISKAIGKSHTTVFPGYYLKPAKRSTSKTERPYISAKNVK